MPADPLRVKVCQICKQDCSKKPRARDAAGQYFCEACLEQRHAEQSLLAGAEPLTASLPGRAPPRDDHTIRLLDEPAGPF